jgi:DNA ligase (NAD+)
MAAVLAEHFGTIERLQEAATEELAAVGGVGAIVAEAVHEYFQRAESRRLISRLLDAGVRIKPPRKATGPLAGKTFVLTGTLQRMTRGEAEERIRELGGVPSSTVSRKTDYVVVGADPGSKLEKAQRLKVPILDEAAFLKLVGAPPGQ